MRSVLLVSAHELRTRWQAWVSLALLVAFAGGCVLTAAVGARIEIVVGSSDVQDGWIAHEDRILARRKLTLTRLDRRTQCVDRMVAALRTRRRRLRHHVRFAAGAAWHARRCRRGAAVMARQVERQIKHRGSALWIAAMVHRLSGLALAIFLPLHFLSLGLAIDGEAVGKETLLTADDEKDYTLTAKLKAGERKLVVEFTNDVYKENEYDRNLYVHAVTLKRVK